MTNRFKELDLIDRVPEKLWMEVCNIVQEVVIETIPKKKNCQKVKWLSEEALKMHEKIREAKGKGEKDRYTHLNTSLDEVYWPCSHSRAIPSFPSQLEWKIGLAWANTRGSLNSPS